MLEIETCPRCHSNLSPRLSPGSVICGRCGWPNEPKIDLQTGIGLRQIRNNFIKGIACEFLPLIILGLLNASVYETLPTILAFFVSLLVLGLFLYGYIFCWITAYDYAEYKGYPRYVGWLGFLNIFGLSFLFLLDNKKLITVTAETKNIFDTFSVTAILISYVAIPLVFLPFITFLMVYVGNVEIADILENLSENEDFLEILSFPIYIGIIWYNLREFKKSKINFHRVFGSLKKVDFILPISLAIIEYFFAWGMNSLTLYSLSFVAPDYVENQINQEHVTTYVGWIFYAFSGLIFAPIMEEFLFRGILFQKQAIKKNIFKGIFFSALVFAIVHFRYDIIPLFTGGVILALLYLNTKRLIIPIIYHFFFNFMIFMGLLYFSFFSNSEYSIHTTIAEYQQQFVDNAGSRILFIVFSAPFLGYFIYKNFPRSLDINNLPYFANRADRIALLKP